MKLNRPNTEIGDVALQMKLSSYFYGKVPSDSDFFYFYPQSRTKKCFSCFIAEAQHRQRPYLVTHTKNPCGMSFVSSYVISVCKTQF